MILGCDVSSEQGPSLDWHAIYASGVQFVFCKATEAQGYVDRTFSRNSSCARAAGLAVGSYHFFSPNRDPEAQARLYHSIAASVTTLPPVIDLETLRGVAMPDVASRALAFIAATEQLWQRRCVVYSYPSFLRAFQRSDLEPLGKSPLWIAHYGVLAPSVPAPWSTWACWQWDGDGGMRLPGGVDADFDWCPDVAALVASCAIARPAPPADPTTPLDAPAHQLGEADRQEQELSDARGR